MGFLLNILAFYIFYLVGFLRGKRRGLDFFTPLTKQYGAFKKK